MNEVENARRMRDEAICKEWQETGESKVKGGTPASRVLARIAADHGISSQQVENILRARGIYQGAREMRQKMEEQL